MLEMNATMLFERVCEVFRTLNYGDVSESLLVYFTGPPRQFDGKHRDVLIASILCIIGKVNGVNHVIHYDELSQYNLSHMSIQSNISTVDGVKQYHAEIFSPVGSRGSGMTIFSEEPTEPIFKYKVKHNLQSDLNLVELLDV